MSGPYTRAMCEACEQPVETLCEDCEEYCLDCCMGHDLICGDCLYKIEDDNHACLNK